MYFVSYFFLFITVMFIIVTMTNLLQSLCIMLSTISNIVLNSQKIMKIMSTLYFETPL